MKKHPAYYIAQGAAIAALYATLTIMQNVLLPGTASAAIQFRAAELLTILAVYTRPAIPGLTIGCIIANLSSISVVGPLDMIFGSAASFIAALLMYALRNVRWFRLPILSALMPALVNGIIVGFEIDFFVVNQGFFNFYDFLFVGGCVALGELGVLVLLGLPLAWAIDKRKIMSKFK